MPIIIRKILILIAVVVPLPIKLIVYRFIGWSIGKNVKIGFSYIDCDHCVLEDNVKIGNFNIIRRLTLFHLGDSSCIKNFNQFFFSGDKAQSPSWCGKIILEKKVMIMSHHFIDAGGSVSVGRNTTIGGRDSHIWSHGFGYVGNTIKKERLRYEVNIGKNVLVGARATILGCSIPDRAIVGAGSVVNKSFPSEKYPILIAGNPATVKKRYELPDNLEK
jgi:acetyltransferase-like isoleucine patch superfamily enzyme